MNKQKLKEVLLGMSSDDEKKELQVLDVNKVEEVIKVFEEQEQESDANFARMLAAFEKYATSNNKRHDALLASFENFSETLSKGLEKTGAAISGSVEKNKSADMSGFFKDFGVQLASSAQSARQSAALIQNLKWNASQQLRDTNGSPINPAIAGFAITAAYDDIQLSNYDGSGNVGTVTYLQSGNVVAILNLTYDGSGNLTDVIRTQ